MWHQKKTEKEKRKKVRRKNEKVIKICSTQVIAICCNGNERKFGIATEWAALWQPIDFEAEEEVEDVGAALELEKMAYINLRILFNFLGNKTKYQGKTQ